MKKIRNWCHNDTRKRKVEWWRMMKFVICFVLMGLIQLSSKVWSQNVMVNLNLRNVTVEEALNRVEKQLQQKFFFSRDKVDVQRKIDVHLSNAGLDELVGQIFGTDFKYRIEADVIVISQMEKVFTTAGKLTVKGIVKDRNGNVLPGVTILLKGTLLGTSTDASGKFALTIPASENVVLEASFVGMKKLEVVYKGQGELTIVMEEESAEMEEVVVTGVFTKARESYTGAATTITAKELQRVGNRNILTSIRNIDPSFYITDNINIGSDPNSLPEITMRGSSSLPLGVKDVQNDASNNPNIPLFIMDGFEISLERMTDLDENQVESITLLKDASATAMYGTRGANGVVVISTKKPEPGKLRVTYKGSVNMELPDLTSYNLLNSEEKLTFEKAAGLYAGNQDLRDLYNHRLLDVRRGVDTYWLKYPVRTGIGHRHSLRLEGGNESFRYAAAIGYNNVAGAMKGSLRNTLNGDVFLSYQYKNLIFQNDLQITVNKSENSPYGTFNDFAKINAYWTPYDDEGNLKKMLENGENIYRVDHGGIEGGKGNVVFNPLYNALLASFDKNQYTQIQNNFAVDWKILSSLTFRGRLGITTQTTHSDRFISPKNTKYDQYKEEEEDRKGEYVYGSGQSFKYEIEFSVNYNQTFAEKHSLYMGVSLNAAQDKNESYKFTAEGFQSEQADFLGMAGKYAENGKPSGSESFSRRMGGILNVNYTYDRRYFADVSGKFDGSSKFGSNSRFAPFWSAGAGWNMHNESFLLENRVLNLARLRLSYGTSGSQSFDAYQAMKTFKFMETTYHGWNSLYLMALGNPDLQWQKVNQLNIGVELEFFHGRVRFNADVYNKVTDDLLADITLPSSSGFDSYKANVGKVSNKGLELSINVYPVRNTERNIVWSVGATLAHNKNEIRKISNTLEFLNEEINKQDGANPSFLFKEGQSMNTIFVVRSLGIDPGSGHEAFVKKDGTKTFTWDANDKVACGVAEPKIWGNITTMFRYKNLTFNAVLGYRAGGQIYNQTLVDKVENIFPYDNADKRVLYDRWKEPGDHAFFKSVSDLGKTKASSRFVMDERTLECRSLSLAYDFSGAWMNKLSLDYLTVSCITEDVFRISTIKQERGLAYPFARKFSVSLIARF